jgi:hypothetical protein
MPPKENFQQQERVRISTDLAGEAADKVDQICHKQGITMAELLRRSLALYAILMEEQNQGRTAVIFRRDKDNNETILYGLDI